MDLLDSQLQINQFWDDSENSNKSNSKDTRIVGK